MRMIIKRIILKFLIGKLLCMLLVGQVGAQSRNDDWTTFNRTLALGAISMQQQYEEQDTQGLTSQGVLNSERGRVPGYQAQARWQGSIDGGNAWPLWLQFKAVWVQGQTYYDGYLQSGSNLTPFRAMTGNTWREAEVSLGMPVSIGLSNGWQAIPLLTWAGSDWRRNLLGYSETYRVTGIGPGLLLQCAVSPQWFVEAGARWLRQRPVHVSVPQLGFDAEQRGGTQQTLHISVTWVPPSDWPYANRWQVTAQSQHSRWANGLSPIVNSLQTPPNQHRQNQFSLAWAWRF